MSIIRPSANDSKKDFENGKFNKNIIFDDDYIHIISKILDCDEEYADKVRRLLCKKDKKITKKIEMILKNKGYKNIIKC